MPLKPVAGVSDAVLGTLPFADQPGADDGLQVRADAAGGNVPAVQLFTEVLQAPDRLGLQPAMGQFLDTVAQPGLDVAPVEQRRLSIEQGAPLLL